MGRLFAFFSFLFEAIRLTFFRRDDGGDDGWVEVVTRPDDGVYEPLYGCPASNKTSKLQTKRKAYR